MLSKLAVSWAHLHPLRDACAHPHVQAHVSPCQGGTALSLSSRSTELSPRLWACLSPGRSTQTRERSLLSARRCHPPTLLGKHLQEKCLSAKAAALLKPALSTAQAARGGRRRLRGSQSSLQQHPC